MLERLAPYVESSMKNRGNFEQSSNFLSGRLFKRYFNKYILLKIKKSIRYSYNNSPFYHDLFENNNIKPADIKDFKDLSKIPLTSSKDVVNFKNFFAVPEHNFIKVFSSSGTTGKPKRIFFTKKDLDVQTKDISVGMQMLYDIDKNDVVRITYDHGYGTDDWGVRYCLERSLNKIDAMSVITSKRLPAEKELNLIKAYNVSVIMGTPSYLNSLTHDLEQIIAPQKLKIKKILLGTEPLPQKVREKLEKTWNTDVYQGYGLTEMGTSVAGECKEKNGMHLSESDFYAEIIDPKTGDVLEDGELGELVFTTLSREGMPLIRYRTHDLGLIMREACPCGLPFRRIKIKGRTDKMITIGSGDNIYPESFNRTLFDLSFIIDYQIILERKNNKDIITVFVETNEKDKKIKDKIKEKILSIPEIENGFYNSKTIDQIKVKIIKPNHVDKNSVKAKRIIDKRNLYS